MSSESSKSSESMQWLYREPNLDRIEDVEKYIIGGYHPVNIGDILGEKENQYEVIHKLGSGGCQKSGSPTKQIRSTISPSRSFMPTPRMTWNSTCSSTSKKDSVTHPNILSLHDVFQIIGPNGSHPSVRTDSD
jgi:serine/threonine-protein kinase SRPK3